MDVLAQAVLVSSWQLMRDDGFLVRSGFASFLLRVSLVGLCIDLQVHAGLCMEQLFHHSIRNPSDLGSSLEHHAGLKKFVATCTAMLRSSSEFERICCILSGLRLLLWLLALLQLWSLSASQA